MPQIEPTIGRIVWYYPSSEEKTGLRLPLRLHGVGPLAAQIAHINPNGTLNLGVLDSSGGHHSRECVQLVQDGQGVPAEAAYATWMPYQVEQAAKTEQAERQQQLAAQHVQQQQSVVQQGQQAAPGTVQSSGDPAPAAEQQPVGDAQSENQAQTAA